MSEIHVKDGESIDSALKRFKRSCAKAGVIPVSSAARSPRPLARTRSVIIDELKSAVPIRYSTFCLRAKAGMTVDGKEGCVRETQEGFPAPLRSIYFRNF